MRSFSFFTKMGLCLLWSVLILPQVLFAQVQVRAYTDKQQVCRGRELSLIIEISGKVRSYSAPDVNSIANARIYGQGSSQRISFINGVVNNQITFSYILLPLKIGKLRIPSFKVKVNGRYYSTDPIDIDVIACSTSSRGYTNSVYQYQQRNYQSQSNIPQAKVKQSLQGEDTFAVISLNKKKVYIGEPLILTYTIYTRERIAFKGFAREPNFEGFVKEEIDPGRDMNRRQVLIGGQRYIAADVMKFVLIPTEQGTLKIDPGELLITKTTDVRNLFDDFLSDSFWDSFFADDLFTATRPYKLSLAPQEVEVMGLPQKNRPSDFSGLIGEFSISAQVDKTEVELGDSLTLTVTVKGTGPLSSLKDLPLADIDSVRLYKSSNSETKQVLKDTVIYKKKFEYILIPEKTGEIKIPSIKINYFSPDQKEYGTAKTRPISITVIPSKHPLKDSTFITPNSNNPNKNVAVVDSGVESVGKDINYIKPKLSFDKFENFWVRFWVINILLLMITILLQLKDKLFTSSSNRSTMSTLRKQIDTIIKQMSSKDEQELNKLWEDLLKNLLDYAGLYYKRKITTLRSLVEVLSSDNKINQEIVDSFRRLLPELEAVLYGARQLDKDRGKEVIRLIKMLLKKWY